MKTNMKRILLILIAVVLAATIIWASSLIRCEVLTKIYSDDFKNAYKQNPMLGEMEYFKVLTCDGKTAEVYYVSKGMTNGDVLSFENHNGAWVETSWDTIWSDTGSASGVIYPYWWDFIYGGF